MPSRCKLSGEPAVPFHIRPAIGLNVAGHTGTISPHQSAKQQHEKSSHHKVDQQVAVRVDTDTLKPFRQDKAHDQYP